MATRVAGDRGGVICIMKLTRFQNQGADAAAD